MAHADGSHESFMDKLKRVFSGEPSTFDQDEDYYRTRHTTDLSASADAPGTSGAGSYDTVRPAYQIGHLAGSSDTYADRDFEDVEPELRTGWESHANAGQAWDDVRDYAREGYGRGQERRIVLSEEQLAVGKRQVSGGEVNLHKTVETHHVSESVPLVHEEVTIERRPLSGADTVGDAQIGEETIRVPLMAEEAVVQKKVVGVEEVVVRKEAKTEQRQVDADVRKERLVTDGIDETTGRSTRVDTDLDSRS